MFSMALWQTFTESANGANSGGNCGEADAGQKINFPREAIVLAKLGEVFLNFAH